MHLSQGIRDCCLKSNTEFDSPKSTVKRQKTMITIQSDLIRRLALFLVRQNLRKFVLLSAWTGRGWDKSKGAIIFKLVRIKHPAML